MLLYNRNIFWCVDDVSENNNLFSYKSNRDNSEDNWILCEKRGVFMESIKSINKDEVGVIKLF